ncbi:MAG: helix-hairpin-helix domain-containing protein [Persicimonas sp.]
MTASDKQSSGGRPPREEEQTFREPADEMYTDTEVPRGAFHVPVSVLKPPSLVENVLERLQVGTVGDLLELTDEQLAEAPGVGTKKIEVIGDLKERAHEELEFDAHGLSEASETQLLSDRLDKRGIDMDEDWERILRVLPTRARGAFESVGYSSIGELVDAFERGELSRLPNFGPKTLDRVEEILELIAAEGLEYYLFGERGRPTTISGLIEQALDSLEDEDRDVIERRFFDGDTFGAIGDDFGVSFQAIQARFDTLVETLEYRYGPEAEKLVDPLVEACEEAGGILSSEMVEEHTDEDDLRRVLFVLHIAGRTDFRLWQNQFLTPLHQNDIQEKLRNLRDQIVETGRAMLPYERIENFARRAGLKLDQPSLSRLFEVAWDVEVRPDRPTQNPWARRSDHVANVLEDAGEPMTAHQILAALESSAEHDSGIDEISERALNGLLHRHEDIYTLKRGVYVHTSALPVTTAVLDEVVDWCVDRLEGQKGQISTKYLLGELADEGLDREGLTPYLLKDALSRHPKVLTFKNTYLVAHAESFEESGKTLADRVEAVLADADSPLTVEDVIDRLPEGIDYHRMSIYTTLLSAPFSLNLGNNRFVHIDFVGLRENRRERLVDAVYDALPEDGTPMSCGDLLDQLEEMPEARSLALRDFGSGLLWGLLREDDRVMCGPGELVARDIDSDRQHVLRTAIGQIVADYGAAYPREVRSELRDQYGYSGSDSAVFGSLTRSAEEGRLLRLPDSLYVCEGSDEEILSAMSNRDREVAKLVRSSDVNEASDRVVDLLETYYERCGHDEQLEQLRKRRG